MEKTAVTAPRPLVIPLTEPQKQTLALEKMAVLLQEIADNTRPAGTKAKGNPQPKAQK